MSIDPKIQYCTCGMTFRPGTIHKILMLLFHEYSWRCPQCGTRMTFMLANHVVKINTETIKNKGDVYKNG